MYKAVKSENYFAHRSWVSASLGTVRIAVKKKLCVRLIKSDCFPASISPHTKNIKKHLHKHNLNYEYLQAKYCDRKYRTRQNLLWKKWKKKWKHFFSAKIQILELICFRSSGKIRDVRTRTKRNLRISDFG